MSTVAQPTPPQPMTEQHVDALLGFLIALDPRLSAPDETTSKIRTSAWTALLCNVDPAFAMEFSQRAYSEPRDWPLQPAEILQAWRQRQEETNRRAEEAHRQQHPEERRGNAARMAAYLRDVFAATQRGESFDSVPVPEGLVVTQSPEARARERRCVWWTICACDHQNCFAGYLDAEVEIENSLGAKYSAVKRCPWCGDAAVMADERGMTKRPTAGGRRR